MNHEKRANNKDVLAEAGVEETSAVKKRQCIGPSAKASIEKASGDTETWHHQLDAKADPLQCCSHDPSTPTLSTHPYLSALDLMSDFPAGAGDTRCCTSHL